MKKITTTKKEKDFYNIEIIIDDVALIKSSISGKNGLLDIKTNELIGELDYYNIKVDELNKLYYQIKNVDSKKVISIYDIMNKKYLVRDFDIVSSFSLAATGIGLIYILKSPVDEKIHLFDVIKCRDKDNIFDKQLNNVTYFDDGLKNTSYILTDINDKKTIYLMGKGPISEYEYDDIEKEDNVVIYAKKDEKSFSFYDCDGVFSTIIGNFKEIKQDKENSNLLYCKDDLETYVYNVDIKSLILKETKDLDCTAFFSYSSGYQIFKLNYEYLFVGTDKETKKKTLVGVMYDATRKEASIKYLAENYDNINFDHFLDQKREVALYLENDKKLDLFIGGVNHNNLLKLESDKIEHLGEDCYAITKDKCTDIIEADDTSYKVAINDCTIIDKNDNALIYSQKNNEGKELEGIFYFGKSKYYGDIYKKNVSAACNKINRISHHLYLADKNNNKGIYFFGRLIIPIEFKSIDIAFSPEFSRIDIAHELYFSLKKEKSNILAKRDMGYEIYDDRTYELEELGEYKDIIFLKDIIVLKELLNTLIYDYNNNLLGKFSPDTSVTSFEVSEDKYNTKTIYCINNNYYFYKDGNLEQYYKEDIDLYLTTYETDTDIFEASSYRKDILDKFTSYIDSMEDDLGEASLNELSNNKNDLKDKYPSLVLRKVKKKEVR